MERETIKTPTLAKAYAPYSPGYIVKKVGSFIFISGVVPNDIDGLNVNKNLNRDYNFSVYYVVFNNARKRRI